MPEIYYKTKKDSETGKKFAELIRISEESKKLLMALCEEFGAEKRYSTGNFYTLDTGVNGFTFAKKPDTKIWKQVSSFPDLWFPRINKVGKPYLEKIDALPKITYHELDDVIGRRSIVGHIGYTLAPNSDYFGFAVMHEWGQKMPEDCEEILTTEYVNL